LDKKQLKTIKMPLDARSSESINARVKLINGNFDLPNDVPPYMKIVRETIAEAAKKITQSLPVDVDAGRTIAALDLLQQAKNTFCDAAILPHHATNK
jgi:hypothetical protein